MDDFNEQYADIAFNYDKSFSLAYRKYVEVPSTISLIKTFKNKHVLDIACGTGFYTRLSKKLGADSVIGVDCSQEMINIAKNVEISNIRYLVADAKDLNLKEQFDLITAIWFLHYFSNEGDLCKIAKII
jgi:toxoflavin synthase